MSLIGKQILCPYCLEKLNSKDINLLCYKCGKPGELTIMDNLFNKVPKCDREGCIGTLTLRQCNHCKSLLPSDILDYEKYLRLSILGTTGAGKTIFLTTMLHELRHSLGSPWVIAPIDSETNSIYQKNVELIYEKKTMVDATVAGSNPPPQLWKIKDKSRMTNKKIPSYSMTIFDGAGEDCVNINPDISRYIGGSKSLVILIDPLSLRSVGSHISNEIRTWSSSAGHEVGVSADMVEGLADYIRESCGISTNKLIDKEVAIVFTKLDTVIDTFGTATVTQPSPHLARKGFVKNDADAVDAEIRDWLEDQGEIAFVNAVETNFPNNKVRFFGISSFGHPPTGESTLGKVIPHRVLDPLFWMLSREGIVPIIY